MSHELEMLDMLIYGYDEKTLEKAAEIVLRSKKLKPKKKENESESESESDVVTGAGYSRSPSSFGRDVVIAISIVEELLSRRIWGDMKQPDAAEILDLLRARRSACWEEINKSGLGNVLERLEMSILKKRRILIVGSNEEMRKKMKIEQEKESDDKSVTISSSVDIDINEEEEEKKTDAADKELGYETMSPSDEEGKQLHHGLRSCRLKGGFKENFEACREYLRQREASDGFDLDINVIPTDRHCLSVTVTPIVPGRPPSNSIPGRNPEDDTFKYDDPLLLETLCKAALQRYQPNGHNYFDDEDSEDSEDSEDDDNNDNENGAGAGAGVGRQVVDDDDAGRRVDNNEDDNASNGYKFKAFEYGCSRMTRYINYLLTFSAISPANVVTYFQAYVLDKRPFYSPQPVPAVQFVRLKEPPSVDIDDVEISGKCIEGATIKGIADYSAGKQGDCKSFWFRESLDKSYRTKVSNESEYTLTKEDVGHCMVFGYTPVNVLGQEGPYVEVTSSIVEGCPSRCAAPLPEN